MSAEAPPRPVRTPSAPAGASTSGRRSVWNRFYLYGAPYVFIAPFFVLFTAFGLFPLVYTAWVSLRA